MSEAVKDTGVFEEIKGLRSRQEEESTTAKFKMSLVGGYNRKDIDVYIKNQSEMQQRAEQAFNERIDELEEYIEILKGEKAKIGDELEQVSKALLLKTEENQALSAKIEELESQISELNLRINTFSEENTQHMQQAQTYKANEEILTQQIIKIAAERDKYQAETEILAKELEGIKNENKSLSEQYNLLMSKYDENTAKHINDMVCINSVVIKRIQKQSNLYEKIADELEKLTAQFDELRGISASLQSEVKEIVNLS